MLYSKFVLSLTKVLGYRLYFKLLSPWANINTIFHVQFILPFFLTHSLITHFSFYIFLINTTVCNVKFLIKWAFLLHHRPILNNNKLLISYKTWNRQYIQVDDWRLQLVHMQQLNKNGRCFLFNSWNRIVPFLIMIKIVYVIIFENVFFTCFYID